MYRVRTEDFVLVSITPLISLQISDSKWSSANGLYCVTLSLAKEYLKVAVNEIALNLRSITLMHCVNHLTLTFNKHNPEVRHTSQLTTQLILSLHN